MVGKAAYVGEGYLMGEARDFATLLWVPTIAGRSPRGPSWNQKSDGTPVSI